MPRISNEISRVIWERDESYELQRCSLNLKIQKNREDEPDQIRNMSKTQLYKFLSLELCLPDQESRCCTRSYLVKVFNREVYTVSRHELLIFEAQLRPDETIKSPFFNIGVLKSRLDRLLRAHGKLRLGYPSGTNADDHFFTRILRYEDPSNMLQGFRRSVRGHQLPMILPGRM